MIPGIDPKVDYAFKYLFGREHSQPVLIPLLEAVLRPPPGEGIAHLEILNPFHDKQALDDKLSILDIKARDQRGRLFNVEMQLLPERAFRNRVLYYWARLYGQQLQEGDDYLLLRPTVSICFVDNVLFPQTSAYHLAFQLRTEDHTFAFTEDLALRILELPKFTRSVEQLTEPLDVWLYFLRHGAQLDHGALPEALNLPGIRRALEDLTVLTQDQLERERYESRLKAQRDERSRLLYAEDEGMARGMARGLEQGLEQGREEGRTEILVRHIHFCQRLLKHPLTPAEQLREMPVEEMERFATQLESQVPSP